MSEDVLHQAHYTRLPLQPILVMMNTVPPEQFLGHLRCCAIKYLMRVDGKPVGERQKDYDKAAQYAAWAAEFERTGTITVPGTAEGSTKRELPEVPSSTYLLSPLEQLRKNMTSRIRPPEDWGKPPERKSGGG